MPFCIDSALPQDLDEFLKNDENKADLNHLIADNSLKPEVSDWETRNCSDIQAHIEMHFRWHQGCV